MVKIETIPLHEQVYIILKLGGKKIAPLIK